MIGLSSKEVGIQEEKGNINIQVKSSTRTTEQIIKENIFTYFNLVFTVLAVLLILVGSFKDLTFMLIVFANAGLGIAQELRSKKALDKLKLMNMPRCKVYRDNNLIELPVEKLVLGDVILLKGGDQIPADGVVLDGSVQVNEALLTGESEEINKTKETNLMSGSFVISGECLAKLTAVGKNSYISQLTIEATKENSKNQSEMIRALDKLVKWIGIIIIPIGIILVAQEWWFKGDSFSHSIIGMVAACLGMIPEGLYMTASVAMVVSTIRLAKNKVLVQNMNCIETLARVDVLCVDKTGTITENKMTVEGFWTPYKDKEEEIKSHISDVVRNQESDNITMEALKKYFVGGRGVHATKVWGFSSKYKYSSVEFDSKYYVLGAPEYIAKRDLHRVTERISKKGEEGYRVLAFCQTREIPDGRDLGENTNLLALIYIRNPIRKSAKKTFEYFAKNGVDVKVISGDNPEVVSNIALEAGVKNANKYIDATHLVTENAIYEAVGLYNVFGRVTPNQKRSFVKALQKRGKIVGMTGDGVNDILALKDADCSIAMASGSDAASNSSQLVLMDSDFSKMPDIVGEGRRVVNNIQKAASLYLTKNIFSMMLAVFSVISLFSYPLKPSQITLISIFTIGIPAFVMSLEPNNSIIKGTFLSNIFKIAAPAGITTFISVSSLVVFGEVFKISKPCISTSSTLIVALVGFMILIKVAKPVNMFHSLLVFIMGIGMGYCIIFHPNIFGIDPLTGEAVMLLTVFMIATEAVFRYIHLSIDYINMVLHKDFKKSRNKRRKV